MGWGVWFGRVRPRGMYRPDIDGMRALAVLAVVAYHYSPSHFPGGFIGVDVFFVISGYLITGILARAIEDKEYPGFGHLLSDFYQRRVRRIFPVLILVLATCLLVGWLVLFSSEFERLGKYVAAGAGYVENFVLWNESGYFNHAADTKPLLHLWSLAVEEQFYIFWPLLLWVIVGRRWPLLRSIGLIALLAFVLNASLVLAGNAVHAFYSPLARTWELMVGAWLAVAHRRGLAWLRVAPLWQALIGLAAIVVGFVLIGPSSAFPGFWALLPVLGSALIINAGSATALNRSVLSWRPVVWVGLISYPLYLWHWALFSLVVIVFGEGNADFRHASRVILFIVSVLLAWLTYRYFEQPVRHSRRVRTSLALVAVVALLGGGGLTVYLASGVPDRPGSLVSTQAQRYVHSIRMSPLAASGKCFNPQLRMTFLQKRDGQAHLPPDWYCRLGDRDAARTVLAYGDSHASALIPALDKYGKQAHVQVVFAAVGSCLALSGVKVRDDYPLACRALAHKAQAWARAQRPAAVLLVESWSGYLAPGMLRDASGQTGKAALASALHETLDHYQRLGIPVLLMQDNPLQDGAVPKAHIRFANQPTDAQMNAGALSLAGYRRQQGGVNAVLAAAAERHAGVFVLDPGRALCQDQICPWALDHQFLYYDAGHLSVAGALRVLPVLRAGLSAAMKGVNPAPRAVVAGTANAAGGR